MKEFWQELIRPEHKLLDVGCWNGKRILELKDKCDVYGMDIDKSKFLEADKAIRDRLYEGDVLHELPFKMKFDFISLRDVIEHLFQDGTYKNKQNDVALANINKAMKMGGYLILSTPKHIPFLNWYDPAWVRWSLWDGEQPHIHYSKKVLFKLLEDYGFEVKHHHLEGTIGWVFSRWINGFLKYGLKSTKQIKSEWGPGYFSWMIVAKKERSI